MSFLVKIKVQDKFFRFFLVCFKKSVSLCTVITKQVYIMKELPSDVMMLLSYVNMKLRDQYGSLDEMCSDMQIDRVWLEKRLGEVGFEYNRSQNRFW